MSPLLLAGLVGCGPGGDRPGAALHLVRGRAVSEASAAEVADATLAFWERYGLELPVEARGAVDLDAALVGTEAELDAALRARGIDPAYPARRVDAHPPTGRAGGQGVGRGARARRRLHPHGARRRG